MTWTDPQTFVYYLNQPSPVPLNPVENIDVKFENNFDNNEQSTYGNRMSCKQCTIFFSILAYTSHIRLGILHSPWFYKKHMYRTRATITRS